jgi:hypothetical protein
MYALIDPNWGEPKPVLTTIRETEEEAWNAAVRCPEVSIYSGFSEFPLPGGTLGKRETLEFFHYRVAPVEIVMKGN